MNSKTKIKSPLLRTFGFIGLFGALASAPFVLLPMFNLLTDLNNPQLLSKNGAPFMLLLLWGFLGWIVLLTAGLIFLSARNPLIVLKMLNFLILTGIITNALALILFRNIFSLFSGLAGIWVILKIKNRIEEQI